MTTTRPRLAPDELRELFLFEDLDDDQLAWLADNGDVVDCPAGEEVSVEGEPADCFFVLLEGTLSMVRLVGGSEVETVRTVHRGVYSGAIQFYFGDRLEQRYPATVRAVTDCRFLALPAAAVRRGLPAVVPDGGAPARGPVRRAAELRRAGRPARAAAGAGQADRRAHPRAEQPGRRGGAGRGRAARPVRRHAAQARAAGRGEDRRRAAAVADRAAGGVRRPDRRHAASCPRWSAPTARTSSATGSRSTAWPGPGTSPASSSPPASDPRTSTRVADAVAPSFLEPALRWLAYTVETETLLAEIADSTSRISEPGRRGQAVLPAGPRAAPADRPARRAGRHAGDARRQDRARLTVVKDYDRSLPQVRPTPAS